MVCAAGSHASSDSLRFCDRTSALTAPQQDRLLRFAAIARGELEASGQAIALIARSGLDLQRFGVRYSHAGLSLKASENTPWSVRQLYYACDEGRPRLYDQGLAGFLFGTDDPAIGYVSIVLLPRDAAAALERAALDKARALRLLAAAYSANAHPSSLRYQNCNQWVIELLATAWGELADGESLRGRAQAWLVERRYAPAPIEVASHALMFAAAFVPWLHSDDHPQEDLFALRFRTSMPASIEAFVREQVPGAERIELCHDERQVVVRRGWEPIADGCRPAAGDRVVALD
ncbi:MAG: DUF2145 domain-containing protein [Pseudomonadota bacterium]